MSVLKAVKLEERLPSLPPYTPTLAGSPDALSKTELPLHALSLQSHY